MNIKKLIPKSIKIFVNEHKYFFKEIKNNNKKKLIEILNENKENTFAIDDKKNWINKLIRLTYSDPEQIELGIAFASANIKVLKDIKIHPTDIIAICVEKDDLLKLRKFITHHRKLGIDKFVILDNNSSDGSVEYLLKQKDVVLLHTKVSYSSKKRCAWINRIIAHYGYNRWYYVADSDELLVYNDCENKTIKDLINYYEEKKIIRARAFLLDMYAKTEDYCNNNINKLYDKYSYFDADTYHQYEGKSCNCVFGGPRERLFNISPTLTKYPLFYFRKKDVFSCSHYLYPYKDNFRSELQLILKHYKFFPGEISKYKKIAIEGNYYNNSIEYKHYMNVLEKEPNLNFMHKNSKRYKNSNSLNEIEIYKKIEWKSNMELEVLLSVVNLNKRDLDKMNIISECTVINQCGNNKKEKYKNFNIYSYNEIGTSNSRNSGLEHITKDIILLCDDDVIYNNKYKEIVIKEFRNNKKADVIFFNFESPNRKKRIIKIRKRLHIYNSLNYATYNIAFRKDSILSNNIKFNTNFGPGAKFNNGSDTIFIRDLFKNKLKVYSSPEYLGTALNEKSTWFKGYNEEFFFNKGALFTAINPKIRHILILQYLIRHKEVLINIKFKEAYRLMLKGSKEYLSNGCVTK